jgi:hypothetical protein
MHEPGPSGQSLPATHAGPPHFSDAEWQRLQGEDRLAGGTIVVLMGAIFTIGLFLYAGVCLTIHFMW